MRAVLVVVVALAWAAVPACGGGGDDDDDDGAADAMAAVDATTGSDGGGGQDLGQFCGTLPDGGPFCRAELSCCGQTLSCTLPDDCAGSTGYLPCDEGADCPSSKICCDAMAMTFCTKNSACDSYGGTPIP